MLWACQMYQSRWTLKHMFCDTYYGYAYFLMIMNVIVLYEMRVINANLEHGLQYYLHSDSVLEVHG